MGGDAFVMKIDLNQFVTGMQLNLFADTVMRHRVKVLVVGQVIIDINASGFDVRVLIGDAWVTVTGPVDRVFQTTADDCLAFA